VITEAQLQEQKEEKTSQGFNRTAFAVRYKAKKFDRLMIYCQAVTVCHTDAKGIIISWRCFYMPTCQDVF